jgi:hypothetical protein
MQLAERPAGLSVSELRQGAVDCDLAGGHEATVRGREKGSSRPDPRRIGHALRVDYALTALGRGLADAITPLCTWGTENAAEMAGIFAERDSLIQQGSRMTGSYHSSEAARGSNGRSESVAQSALKATSGRQSDLGSA